MIGLKYFEGVRVFVINYGRFKKGAAVTIPELGIFVGPGYENDIGTLRHEFGHILQYRKYGARTYWGKIAPASLKSARHAGKNKHFNHMRTWTEWSANKLAWEYFNKPADWDMAEYPVSSN